MDTRISVGDAMTVDVKTAKPTDSISKITKTMVKHHIGCVIIIENGPVGMITEADIVGIVSAGKDPQKIRAKDVMSSPVISVPPQDDVIGVARMMAKYNIRRVPIMDKKKLVGIATSHDLLRVAAEEDEILSELVNVRLGEIIAAGKHRYLSGICESCRNESEFLREVNGRLLCQECVDTGEE